MSSILEGNEGLLLSLHKNVPGEINIIDHYTWLLRKFARDRKPQLLEFLRSICVFNGDGLSVNQEKIHMHLFNNAETHSKAVITTTTTDDMKTLYVTFLHPSGIGEENVALNSCFSQGQPVKYE